MTAIYKKELASYFKNPIGYICLALYYFLGGQFFLMQISYSGTNDITGVFSNLYLVVLLTLPLLTMRLLSEEKRQRTDQALYTSPVSLTDIVAGKYLAALTLYLAAIFVTVIYYLVFSSMSSPNGSIFAGNFLGLFLLGAALIAIGLFVSAMTESQVIAAVGTFGCMLLILILDEIGSILPSDLHWLSKSLSWLSFSGRYNEFTAGILSLENAVFFISVTAVFLFLTTRVLDKNRFVQSKRVKNVSMSVLLSFGFIAAVVLVNIVLGLSLKRVSPADLTEDGRFRLTEDSTELLAELDEDIRIHVLYDEAEMKTTEYGRQIDSVLRNYERENARVSVDFINILTEPEFVAKYADYNISEGSVIFETDRRTKVVALSDCVETVLNSSGTGYNYTSVAEQQFTSALLYVTEDTVVRVTVLTGHQEAGCQDIINYLESNNYEIREQNLSTEKIDPESAMVFMLAPMDDYTPEELKKLDAFLDNDGNFDKQFVYVASYEQPELPSLMNFLSEWGMTVSNDLIVETDASNVYDGQGFMFSAVFGEKAGDCLSGVRNPVLPFLGYYCRAVTKLWDEDNNRTADMLVSAPESAVLYRMADGSTEAAASPDELGIAVLGERIKYIGSEKHTSHVAVFGSNSMFSSNSTVGSSFNNRDFTVELFNDLVGKKASLSIPAVSFEAEKLNVTQSQYRAISAVLGLLLPILTFAVGMAVWLRRRHL